MSTKGYKQLAQGPDHDLSLKTEQEGQSNEYGHGAERTASSTDSTNPANGQSDPSVASNANPTTTTTTNDNSGIILSFEMDLSEPLVVDTPMDRFRCTLFGKKRTLLVGCAAVLIGIVVLSLTVMKFSRHKMTDDSLRETLVHLIQSRVSSISFDSPTSPESKALDWMVNADEFNHTAVSDDRLVQRFAAAAMVYSMGLEGRSDTLTSESVCKWGNVSLKVWYCNDDGVVDSIFGDGEIFRSENCPVPASIGLLTGLTTLDFDESECTSTIPTEIGLLTGLTILELSEGSLAGTIPTEIGLLTGLTTLYLNNNKLTGTIPTEIGLLTSLGLLFLYNNDLIGSIPTHLCSDPYTFFRIDCDKITCSCCEDEDRFSCPAN